MAEHELDLLDRVNELRSEHDELRMQYDDSQVWSQTTIHDTQRRLTTLERNFENFKQDDAERRRYYVKRQGWDASGDRDLRIMAMRNKVPPDALREIRFLDRPHTARQSKRKASRKRRQSKRRSSRKTPPKRRSRKSTKKRRSRKSAQKRRS